MKLMQRGKGCKIQSNRMISLRTSGASQLQLRPTLMGTTQKRQKKVLKKTVEDVAGDGHKKKERHVKNVKINRIKRIGKKNKNIGRRSAVNRKDDAASAGSDYLVIDVDNEIHDHATRKRFQEAAAKDDNYDGTD